LLKQREKKKASLTLAGTAI